MTNPRLLLALCVSIFAFAGAAPVRAACSIPPTFADTTLVRAAVEPVQSAVADYDGDGRDDLVFADASAGTIVILRALGQVGGKFRFAELDRRFLPLPVALAAANLNADGLLDLVAVSNLDGEVFSFLGQAGGTLRTVGQFPATTGARTVALGDVDADGIPDAFVGGSAGYALLLGGSAPGVADGTYRRVLARTDFRNILSSASGDFDGDHVPDVVFANGSRVIAFVPGGASSGIPGGTMRPAVVMELTTSAVRGVAAADLNGDGRQDLVLATGVGAHVRLAGPAGVFAGATTVDVLGGMDLLSVSLPDLQGDERPDVVGVGRVDKRVSVVHGSAAGFGPTLHVPLATLGVQSASGDFDADGLADLAVTSPVGRAVVLHRGACDAGPPGFARLRTTVVGNGSVVRVPDAVDYPLGTTVELRAVPGLGQTLREWSGGATGNAPVVTLVMDRDLAVTATFEARNYTVSLDIVGNGSVVRVPDRPTYLYNEQISFTAHPAPHHHLIGWSGALVGRASTTVLRVTDDANVTAHFGIDSLELETFVQPVGGGSISRDPDGPLHPYGSMVRLEATPAPGYDFKGWEGDVPGSADPGDPVLSVVVTSAVKIFASFSPRSFPVTAAATPGGRVVVTPNRSLYVVGTRVRIEAFPDLAQLFTGWSGDAVGTTHPLEFDVSGPTHVTAMFSDDPLARPAILSIRDVPADDGGRVTVRWRASSYETTPRLPPESRVGQYMVWRSVPADAPNLGPGLAAGTVRRRVQSLASRAADEFWEWVGVLPATRAPDYSFVAPTAADSGAGGIPWTHFLIQARTLDDRLWLDSAPDSGYSVGRALAMPAVTSPGASPDTPILEIWPNPARERVVLRLAEPARMPWSGELIDVQGRRLARSSGASGTREVMLDIPASVRAGVCGVRVVVGSRQWIRKLAVVR